MGSEMCIRDSSRGRLCVIEVKRGDVTRDAIGQVLEYASWLAGLSEEDIESIAKDYFIRRGMEFRSLKSYISDFMGEVAEEDIEITPDPRIILVGQRVPDEVKLICEYLRKYGIDIYCVEIGYYESEGGVIISTQTVVGASEAEKLKKELKRSIKSRYYSFFKSILDKLDEGLSDTKYKNYKSRIYRNYMLIWYVAFAKHFEVWIKERGRKIEVALHLEGTPKENQRYFDHLKKYEEEFKNKISEELEFYDWPTKYNWKSIRVIIPVENELSAYVDKVSELLAKMIESIQPKLEELA